MGEPPDSDSGAATARHIVCEPRTVKPLLLAGGVTNGTGGAVAGRGQRVAYAADR